MIHMHLQNLLDYPFNVKSVGYVVWESKEIQYEINFLLPKCN